MSTEVSYWIKVRTKTLPILRGDGEGRNVYTAYRWTKWHPVNNHPTFREALEEYEYLDNEPGTPSELVARPETEYAIWKSGKKVYP